MRCSNCGAEIKSGMKFCTKCGARVKASASENNQSNVNVDSGHNSNVRNSNSVGASQPSGNYGQSTNAETVPIDNNQNQNINFNQQQSFAPQTNQTSGNSNVNALKQNSLSYFNWFKRTITNPSNIQSSGKYNGLISIIINALILAASIYVVGSQVLSALTEAFNKFLTLSDSYQQIQVKTSFVFYIKALIVMIIFFAIFLVIGYLCKKYLLRSKESFTTYVDTFANLSNSMIVAELILAIYLLIAMPRDVSSLTESATGLMIFLTILLVIIFGIFVTAYVISIFHNSTKVRLDKVYVAAISLFASNIIVYFAFKFLMNVMF